MSVRQLIVLGAGLAGLAATQAALEAGLRDIEVLEYQQGPGGLLGPALQLPCFDQQRAFVQRCRQDVLPRVHASYRTTAMGVMPDAPAPGLVTVLTQGEDGPGQAVGRAVVLATGGWETPVEAMGVPGSRPAGVMTPHLALCILDQGYHPARRLAVFGGSPYALDTAGQLKAAGMELAAILIPPGNGPAPELAERLGCPVVTGAALVQFTGSPRLAQVHYRSPAGPGVVQCDGAILAAGLTPNWLPVKNLLLDPDPDTNGLVTGPGGETRIPGLFAAGGCVHPDLLHARSRAGGSAAGRAAAAWALRREVAPS